MSKSLSMFFQVMVVLLAIAVAGFLIWEPNVEGVNANATSFAQVYLDDPFLAYVYLASIPFFVGLFHAFKVLGELGQGQSQGAARRLQIIRYCAILNIPLVAGAVAFIFSNESDDRPPVIMMATLVILASIAVALIAGKLKRKMLNQPASA
jgi:hypothetical protein